MRGGFLDAATSEQISEFIVELGDVLVRWFDSNTQNQPVADVAHAVVNGVEAHDFVVRFFKIVRHEKQRHVGR